MLHDSIHQFSWLSKKRLERHIRDRNAGLYRKNNWVNKKKRSSKLYDIQQCGNDGCVANVIQTSVLPVENDWHLGIEEGFEDKHSGCGKGMLQEI